MPDFDLANGIVVFKGDTTQFEEDLKKSEEKLKNLNKSLENGGFKMQLYAAKAFNKELEQTNRQVSRMMKEVQYGKLGAAFRDAIPSLRQFGKGAMIAGTAGAAAGGAAIAAAGQASPLAADTLDKSFKLFTATVGQTFIPLIMDLSFALQDAAKYWSGLSKEVKSNVLALTKAAAVTGVTTLALTALAKGLSFIYAHPLIALLAGAAGVASLGESRIARQQNDVAGVKNIINGTTEEDAARGWMGQRLAGMNKEDAKVEANRLFTDAWNRYNSAVLEHREVATGARGLVNSLKGNDAEEKALQRVANTGVELEQAKFNLQKFAGVKLPQREEGGAAQKRGDLGIAGPASFTQASELLRSIQLKAAGSSPLDAQLEALKRSNDLLANIEKNTAKPGNLVN